MTIARILSPAAREEARKKGDRLTPANDNDPRGPPPAAASRIPHRALSRLKDERRDMQHYDFAVLKNDETIAARKSVELPDLKAAWSHVTELARTINEPGSQIRVTNRAGEVEILAGVAIARSELASARAA
jgi:hypothetical protein